MKKNYCILSTKDKRKHSVKLAEFRLKKVLAIKKFFTRLIQNIFRIIVLWYRRAQINRFVV